MSRWICYIMWAARVWYGQAKAERDFFPVVHASDLLRCSTPALDVRCCVFFSAVKHPPALGTSLTSRHNTSSVHALRLS